MKKVLFFVDVHNMWHASGVTAGGKRVDFIKLRKTARALLPCDEMDSVAYVTSGLLTKNDKFKMFLSNIGYIVRDKTMNESFGASAWSGELILQDVRHLVRDEEYAGIIVASHDGIYASLADKYDTSVICFKDKANKALVDSAKSTYYITDDDLLNKK